jgi:hypothetical protein
MATILGVENGGTGVTTATGTGSTVRSDSPILTGNVGIGEISPTTRLHIKGNHVVNRGLLSIEGLSGQIGLMTLYSGGSYSGAIYGGLDGSFNILNPTAGMPLIFSQSTTEKLRIHTNGCIGVELAAPTARLHIRSSVGTAGTAPLKINSGTLLSPVEAGAIEFDGASFFYTTNTPTRNTFAIRESQTFTGTQTFNGTISIMPGGSILSQSGTLTIYHRNDIATGIVFAGAAPSVGTTGNKNAVSITDLFSPTSGTGTHASLNITPTINQTGGANGVTRAIYVSPVLTAAADFRAIEIVNNSGYGIYQSGTVSKNYFAGNTGHGVVSPANTLDVLGTVKLDISGKGAGNILTSDANGVATWQPNTGGTGTLNSRVILVSNTAISNTTTTTENTVYTGVIPGGSIGINGSIHCTSLYSMTNNANVKTVKIKFNGVTVFNYILTASQASVSFYSIIRNRASMAVQVGGPNNSNSGGTFNSGSAVAVGTYTFNTAADITVTVTIQNAVGTDTSVLEALEFIANF